MRTFMTLLLLTGLAACGGDSSTEPEAVSIAGTWTFQTGGITIEGLTCTTTGRTMTINQSGAQFTGQLAGGMMVCESESGSSTQDLTGFTDGIVNGEINGTSISFDLDVLPGTSLTGTVSGNTLSGTIVEQTYTETGVASGTGSWSATR